MMRPFRQASFLIVGGNEAIVVLGRLGPRVGWIRAEDVD